MDKHTPGPWSLKTYTYFSGGTEQGDVIDADGRTIRVCGVSLTSTPESKANARLIAAAPELLEALQDVLRAMEEHEQLAGCASIYGDNARAAIAKATGEQA